VVELLLLMQCLLSFLMEKFFQFLTLLFQIGELLSEVLLFYLKLLRMLLLSLSRVETVTRLEYGSYKVRVVRTLLAYSVAGASAV
jgi:hypothetical protein